MLPDRFLKVSARFLFGYFGLLSVLICVLLIKNAYKSIVNTSLS